jgi:hypothetical protein
MEVHFENIIILVVAVAVVSIVDEQPVGFF